MWLHGNMKAVAVVLFLSCLSTSWAFVSPYSREKSRPSPDSSLSAERKPWEFGRFLSQSSRFVQMPFAPTTRRQIRPGDRLFPQSDFSFAPLDDVVMGGASSSTVRGGQWRGTVTDANNGGFIGIRSTPAFEYDMSACKGLVMRMRLMSRQGPVRFKLGVRDTTEFNGIVWNCSFDLSPNVISTVRVPFSKLVPTLFANVKRDGSVFRKDRLCGIQFVYSKFEYDGDLNPKFNLGDMQVEVLDIDAY